MAKAQELSTNYSEDWTDAGPEGTSLFSAFRWRLTVSWWPCIGKGFSRANLVYMRAFADARPDVATETNLKRTEALRQSILKKAFSGQLVPQDPNDEPASELLQRIQVQKAELAAQAKVAKAVTKKKSAGRKRAKSA